MIPRPFRAAARRPLPEDGAEPFPGWERNTWTLSLGNLLTNVGYACTFPFLPFMARELAGEAHLELWVGVMVFGYFGMSFLLTPLWGVMADHFGRKSMVLRAGLGMGAGFFFLPFLDRPAAFTALLLLTGIANGFVPAGMALIVTNTPQRQVGRSLSLAQAAALLGTTGGPLLGAWLATALPRYRELFWVSSATTALAGLLALLLVRERRSAPAGALRLDLAGDLRRLLRVPRMALLYYLNYVFAATFFGVTAVVSLFTLELLNRGPSPFGLSAEVWVGITAMSQTVASAIALPAWGRVLDRLSPTRVVTVQLAGSFVTALLLPLVQDPLQLAGARVLFGLFMAGLSPALVHLIKRRAPRGMDARALSYGTALQSLGNGLAPLVAGLLAPLVGLRGYLVLSALLILAGLVWWAPPGRRSSLARRRPAAP
ncbi:MAG: MFS transporter [Candidatus Lambdaproteobacteria bacterium]|nr:MFS transporter [Candidatus Lambdaproteobacteria bacterium]